DATVDARLLARVILAGERALGAVLAGHLVLLRRELCLPLRLGLGHLVHAFLLVGDFSRLYWPHLADASLLGRLPRPQPRGHPAARLLLRASDRARGLDAAGMDDGGGREPRHHRARDA